MTPSEAVAEVSEALAAAGMGETRLQAEVLVMHLLSLDRARLYAAWREPVIEQRHQGALRALLERRLCREPLAYIVGRWEFYGLEFEVDPRVLIPRPETELLVEKALQIALAQPHRGVCTVADVGTGSGAVAIALGTYLPQARLYATDISAEALEVAQRNVARHGLGGRIALLQGDLLAPVPAPVEIVVSNPPYVRDDDLALREPELEREPEVAFRGGPEGLDAVERLLEQASAKLAPGGTLLVEISPCQADAARRLACAAFPQAEVNVIRDLADWERVLVVQTRARPGPMSFISSPSINPD